MNLRLRTQLVLAFAMLVTIVVLVTAGYFVRTQQQEMLRETEVRRVALRTELEKRGTAIARNVAMASERAVATLDFLFLTEILQTTLRNDEQFLYGAIMDNTGTAQ